MAQVAEYPGRFFDSVAAVIQVAEELDETHGPGRWSEAGLSRRQETLVREFVGQFRHERPEPPERR